MKINYEAKGLNRTVEVTDFYKDVASMLCRENLGIGLVTVTCKDGMVRYLLRKRSDTMFIVEESNTLPQAMAGASCPKRYLTCVNADKNAYKFYKMEPCGDELKVSYGRMGVEKGQLFGERTFMYPLSMFWIKYYEKLSKGYVDNTAVYFSADNENTGAKETSRKQPAGNNEASMDKGASAKLFAVLRGFAKTAVREAKVSVPVTKAIIKKSEQLLDSMRGSETVKEFNDFLLQLIAILQRPVRTGDGSGVRRLMAGSKADFPRILHREKDLLMAMDGIADGRVTGGTDFSGYGIEVYEATDEQKNQALSKLSPALKSKAKAVYRVIPKAHRERFNLYLKEHKIKTVKQFWHGSRNQNWMSIIRNGLLLDPDAIITGKMFSDGIYFAPSSEKSWNYTSYRGTSWANGQDDHAFMGLYATAYGTPYDVHTWTSKDWKQDTLNHGADCLHAHAGTSLRSDEIVFYNESAVVLNYIVEF